MECHPVHNAPVILIASLNCVSLIEYGASEAKEFVTKSKPPLISIIRVARVVLK